MPHSFGGTWTELKLEVIEGYLAFYTTVLREKPTPVRPFNLWYIDAFAGSGSRTTKVTKGGLFEGGLLDVEDIELAGSARRALEVQPGFQHFRFVEGHGGRFRDLSRLIDDYPNRDVRCLKGDANAMLKLLFSSRPWSDQLGGSGLHRAVVFLDPYGMAVDWSTLELLAKTAAADVWYLLPVEAINRQAANKLDRVDGSKQVRLDEIYGTSAWRDELYRPARQGSFLDMFGEEAPERAGSKDRVEEYWLERIRTVFRYVSPPIRINAEGRGHIFSLVCLANPAGEPALRLIKKGVNWLVKRYG